MHILVSGENKDSGVNKTLASYSINVDIHHENKPI